MRCPPVPCDQGRPIPVCTDRAVPSPWRSTGRFQIARARLDVRLVLQFHALLVGDGAGQTADLIHKFIDADRAPILIFLEVSAVIRFWLATRTSASVVSRSGYRSNSSSILRKLACAICKVCRFSTYPVHSGRRWKRKDCTPAAPDGSRCRSRWHCHPLSSLPRWLSSPGAGCRSCCACGCRPFAI